MPPIQPAAATPIKAAAIENTRSTTTTTPTTRRTTVQIKQNVDSNNNTTTTTNISGIKTERKDIPKKVATIRRTMSISKLRGKSVLGPIEGGKSPKEGGKTSPPSPPAATATTTTTTTASSAAPPPAAPLNGPAPSKQQLQHLLPQAALLKIEPFVPSFNTRLRRPISRSYSTLSTHHLKRSATTAAGSLHAHLGQVGHVVGAAIIEPGLPSAAGGGYHQHKLRQAANGGPTGGGGGAVGGGGGHLRRHPVKVLSRQRSKSTSSSASNRPGTVNGAGGGGNHTPNAPSTANGSSASGGGGGGGGATTAVSNGGGSSNSGSGASNSGIIVTPQPNGIFRITRLPREQEKLPDRINYDRRGLTAIPIFEHEANLRLLSLQHNLINVFHIPKEAAGPVVPVSESTTPKSQPKEAVNGAGGPAPQQQQPGTRLQRPQMRGNALGTSGAGGGIRFSLNVPGAGGTQQQGSGTGAQNALPSANGATNGRPSLLQRNLYNSMLQQQQQVPQPAQQSAAQYRFGMRKSKSFVSNYSRYLNSVKRTMQQRQLYAATNERLANANGVNGAAGSLAAHLKSFDSSTSASVLTTTATNDSSSLGGYGGGGEALGGGGATEEADSLLEIKNRQLSSSYGKIFSNLVFLDLYDNQIERIANLDGLPNLSVLLLGKNRISDIGGLSSLKDTLRVLDLHGNKIQSLSNKINCLQELKSLNLAGNQLRCINPTDFSGLQNLKELNLKRNKIKRINGFQHLVALERLWLCHNDLHKVDDMASIAKACQLIEVTIENNPVSLAGDCVSFLVSYLPRLQSLSQMPVTEQVRRAAMAWRKNKELSDANYTNLSSDVFNNIRREEVISNARTNWELLRSQQNVQAAFRGKRRGGISPKKCELGKINESNEAVLSYEEEIQDFVKLPPIQQQQQTANQGDPPKEEAEGKAPPPLPQTATATKLNEDDPLDCGAAAGPPRSGSSGSSLGPNVDSSSSCFSSDNEESSKSSSKSSKSGELSRRRSASRPTRLRKCPKANKLRGNATATPPPSCPKASKDRVQFDSPATSSSAGHSKRRQRSSPRPLHETAHPADARQRKAAAININTEATKDSPAPVAAATPDSPLEGVGKATDDAQASANPTGDSQPPQFQPAGDESGRSRANGQSNSSVTNGPAAKAAPQSVGGKRYTPSSFVKSHTVVGGGGGSSPAVPRSGNKGPVGWHIQAPSSSAMLSPSQQPSSGVASSPSPINALSTTSIVTMTNHGAAGLRAPTNGSQSASPAAGATAPGTATSSPAAAASIPATSTTASSSSKATEREREQGGDYLIEISGRYLNIYGQGALRFIDKQWNAAKANDVHTLNFSYIHFNNIVAVLGRIKVRFPHAENFVFRETNISCLGQLNALAELQGITSLFIDPEGNAITLKDMWRPYAIYRLSHWGLKLLNGCEVTDADVEEANAVYVGLSELVLWSMPDAMLQPLLARLRLDESCSASKMTPKEWLKKEDNKSLRLVVGKEALQWKKPSAATSTATAVVLQQQQQQQLQQSAGAGVQQALSPLLSDPSLAGLSLRERGRLHLAMMMENTCNAIEKLRKLDNLWPSLLLEIVRNTLLDYSQLDAYLRNLMTEVMRN